MTERDPIEFLPQAMDRVEDPDPDFAAELLDQLLRELGEASPDDAVPLPSAEIDDPVHGEPDEQQFKAGSTVQMLPPIAERPSQRPRLGRRAGILTAAAVALLVLGSLAILRLGGDDRTSFDVTSGGDPTAVIQPTAEVDESPDAVPPTPLPTPVAVITPEQQVAIDFLTARSNHDGPAMVALLADDAVIANDYGIFSADDYLGRAEFERLTNTVISDITCEAIPESERVSCVYSFRNDIGRHLRTTPYRAEMIVTVRAGRIDDLTAATDGIAFESDIESFLEWLGQAYAEDFAAVDGEPVFVESIDMQVTADSGAILAARTPEFVTSVEPPILKLLADDPRFSTVLEALERTKVGDGMAYCAIGPSTLFAPTNAAFDRYLAESGGERATVLDDAPLLRSLIVSGVVTMQGPDSLAEQAIDIETLSGRTVTVAAGTTPTVEDIPTLPDATDVAACNGAIHGIDQIYPIDN